MVENFLLKSKASGRRTEPARTLTEVHWNSTLISANAVEEVRGPKAGGDGVIEVGGVGLAASLMPHGLIDESQLFLSP